jgi:hypothetical protein
MILPKVHYLLSKTNKILVKNQREDLENKQELFIYLENSLEIHWKVNNRHVD